MRVDSSVLHLVFGWLPEIPTHIGREEGREKKERDCIVLGQFCPRTHAYYRHCKYIGRFYALNLVWCL